MGKENQTAILIRPGEELVRRASETKLLVFTEIGFEDFLGKVAGKGFTRFLHCHNKNPGDSIIFASSIGVVEMIFTDGSITEPVNGMSAFDFYLDRKPQNASYVAHIKQPTAKPDPLYEGTDMAQVLIISNRKAKEVRKLINRIEGLQDIDITFQRLS